MGMAATAATRAYGNMLTSKPNQKALFGYIQIVFLKFSCINSPPFLNMQLHNLRFNYLSECVLLQVRLGSF